MSISSIIAGAFARDNSQSGADLFVGLRQNGAAVFTETVGAKESYILPETTLRNKLANFKSPDSGLNNESFRLAMIAQMKIALRAVERFVANPEDPAVQAMVQTGEAAMGFTVTPTGLQRKR